MQSKTKAHLALLGTNLFFGINFSAVKFLFNEDLLKPFALNLLRVGICALLLWVLWIFQKERQVVQRKDWGRFMLCALTGVAINQLLFIKGLSMTYSIHASLLMLITPILITFIAAWILKEKITWNKLLGLGLGITGAIILITARGNSGSGSDIWLGDVLIILNAVSYTFYFILVKPLMKHYSSVLIIRMIFTIGFFMILPFCWIEFQEIHWNQFSGIDFAVLTQIVVGGTFLAYLFNVYGIRAVGASVAGSYIYTQPFFAAIIAGIFLHENLSFYKMMAAVCIFAGVYLVNRKIN